MNVYTEIHTISDKQTKSRFFFSEWLIFKFDSISGLSSSLDGGERALLLFSSNSFIKYCYRYVPNDIFSPNIIISIEIEISKKKTEKFT